MMKKHLTIMSSIFPQIIASFVYFTKCNNVTFKIILLPDIYLNLNILFHIKTMMFVSLV